MSLSTDSVRSRVIFPSSLYLLVSPPLHYTLTLIVQSRLLETHYLLSRRMDRRRVFRSQFGVSSSHNSVSSPLSPLQTHLSFDGIPQPAPHHPFVVALNLYLGSAHGKPQIQACFVAFRSFASSQSPSSQAQSAPSSPASTPSPETATSTPATISAVPPPSSF